MNPSTAKRYLPWVVAVALFMEGLDTTIVNTAVPAIAEGLQVAPLSLKAAVTSYLLSLAMCIPVSGWMADRFARAACSASRSETIRDRPRFPVALAGGTIEA